MIYTRLVKPNIRLLKNMNYAKCYYITNPYRILKQKYLKNHKQKRFAGKRIASANYGNENISKAIVEDKPYMAGRYGSNEIFAMAAIESYKIGLNSKIQEEFLCGLTLGAGFFSKNDNEYLKYLEIMQKCSKSVDSLFSYKCIMEDYFIKKYTNKVQLFEPRGIEPYYFNNPWSVNLEGKKVLVIHPFEKTIQKQYTIREKLFKNKLILPRFDLKTIKAVQSIAGEKCDYETWFDALESMLEKAMKIEFDIALIGCGAYGFPLAAMIKETGKKAIHMGGCLQVLFGIKGNRWINHPTISHLINDYWVKPLPEETPINAEKVENGCYW